MQLRTFLGKEAIPGAHLIDAARYVDDVRLVLSVDQTTDIQKLEDQLFQWLNGVLDRSAPGLKLSREKTIAGIFRGEERPVVKQSKKMRRIQSAVSGGFDATGGSEILGSILGLIGAQKRLGALEKEGSALKFLPVPDVKDETVDRFAAARFRSTYRSLRPLLYLENLSEADGNQSNRFGSSMSREELDEEAKAFAYELISKWIEDPSNVRLLRIGLDIWPDAELLSRVISILMPVVLGQNRNPSETSVARYCIAELFRAGAVETGSVDDNEKLSTQVDVQRYRKRLTKAAISLLRQTKIELPWFLKQCVPSAPIGPFRLIA
jgi:hypothetical protein